MFKSIKLKKMERQAQKLVLENISMFQKYNTKVTFKSDSSHYNVEERNGVECIIPYGMICSWSTQSNVFKEIKEINFCMNSIYKIAKIRNEDPMLTLGRVFSTLVESLRNGVHIPNLAVRNPRARVTA